MNKTYIKTHETQIKVEMKIPKIIKKKYKIRMN